VRADPFGVERVFVGTDGRAARSLWAFAPGELDAAAASAWLCGTGAPALLRGVTVLPPGTEIEPSTGRIVRWWTAPEPAPGPSDDDEAAGALMVQIELAVRAMAGRRAACLLSGGLDSAVIAAILAAHGWLTHAWTIADDFSGAREELARARAIAAHLGVGARHRELAVSEADLPGAFADTVVANEAPVINGRAVALHLAWRALAAAGEKRVMTGAGADEILLGNALALATWPVDRFVEGEIGRSLLRAGAPAAPGEPPLPAESVHEAQLRALAEQLPDVTLPPERAARAAGVEPLAPFLDRGVAELALALPMGARERRDLGLGKWPLRQAARGLVPEEVRLAPKTPRLAPPGGGGLAAQRAWGALLAELLAPERVARLGIVEPARVTALRDQHAVELDPRRRARSDRVLLRLASLVVLQERAGTA
jgi:asparagine synthase (glutamine-hydrolysing)